MGQLRFLLQDMHAARTWTERLYLFSPLAEAAAKSILSRAVTRKAANANNGMASGVASINARALTALTNGSGQVRVRSGPFAGLSYLDQSTGSVLGPKLLGTYENELHGWIEDAIARNYGRIIDVGCAEGYYAVGMAVACATANVYAYDLDATSQERTVALAALNGVSGRVHVGGLCNPAELARLIADENNLLIVDIEGAENELLDPEATPQLRHTDLIVETHEKFRPGVLWRLLNRFMETHSIDIVSARTDDARIADAIAAGIDRDVAEAAVPEHRALPQLWLRLTARTGPA